MKLWVDNLRPAPDETWTHAFTSDEAVLHLLMRDWDVMSLDHDLGGEDTTRAVILWLCEWEPTCWPRKVRVHTANPVGRRWLEGMIERYKPMTEDEKFEAEKDYARAAGEYFRPMNIQPGALVTDRWSGNQGRVLERLEPQGVLLAFVVRWKSGATTNTYLSALALTIG